MNNSFNVNKHSVIPVITLTGITMNPKLDVPNGILQLDPEFGGRFMLSFIDEKELINTLIHLHNHNSELRELSIVGNKEFNIKDDYSFESAVGNREATLDENWFLPGDTLIIVDDIKGKHDLLVVGKDGNLYDANTEQRVIYPREQKFKKAEVI